MSNSSGDDKQREFVRALEEALDYLEFSADKSNFVDSQYYLAVRNYIQLVLKEIKTKT